MRKQNKGITAFWQATGLLLFAFSLSAPSGEPALAALTARQGEILRELASMAPPGYAGAAPWMLSAWDTDAGLDRVLDFPAGPGNAAENFARLETLFPGEREALEADEGADCRGVDELLAAAEKGVCRLVPDFYPEFGDKQPDFVVFRLYQQALARRADRLHSERGDIAGAERCHRAALLCGRHLTRDKSGYVVFTTGLIVKQRAAGAYQLFLRKTGRAERADILVEYAGGLVEILKLCLWKMHTALGETGGFASLPATILIAERDREAFWRKEAVVRLALLRFGSPDAENRILHRNPMYEKAAEDALKAVAATDPDPSVRRLAAWSVLNLRPGDYDSYEQRFAE